MILGSLAPACIGTTKYTRKRVPRRHYTSQNMSNSAVELTKTGGGNALVGACRWKLLHWSRDDILVSDESLPTPTTNDDILFCLSQSPTWNDACPLFAMSAHLLNWLSQALVAAVSKSFCPQYRQSQVTYNEESRDRDRQKCLHPPQTAGPDPPTW